jgi:hypothetical protein
MSDNDTVDFAYEAAPEPLPRRRKAPSYSGITSGVALLKAEAAASASQAKVCYGVAAILMLGAIVFAFAGAQSTMAGGGVVAGVGIMILLAVFLFAAGKILAHRAIMSALQADLALAQRDVAINSFK